jgi:GTP-binding protein EngB required for normal cell division
MIVLHEDTRKLLSWYREDARQIIEELAPDRISEFDQRVDGIQKLASRGEAEIAACFLGKSGVGKSTLINALIADDQVLLPAGGIGPLTALAIQVIYSENPRFRVEYHAPVSFNRMLFALERGLERIKGFSSLKPAELTEAPSQDENDVEHLEQFERQARLMIIGDQNLPASLEYLVDGLRAAAGRPLRWGSAIKDEDAERIEKIRAALARGKQNEPYVCSGSRKDPNFMKELKAHAAGYLAPLIRNIELGWPSQILQNGLRLIDLPGVGISGDVYRRVTEKWVRDEAKAVCLIVDRSGIDSASADLLRTSGFLNRLLHSTDDPDSDPVSLIIVVVKTDEVAFENFKQERAGNPESYRNKQEHLAEIRAKMPVTIQVQLHDEFRKLIEDLEGPARDASEHALARIKIGLQIHCLTAHEFVKLLDEDETPFIKYAAESGVPQFKDALIRMVENKHRVLRLKLLEMSTDFRNSVSSQLRSLEAQWQGEMSASRETERIRGELQEFLPPLRRELYARQGKFHEFLKEGIPNKIEALVESAGTAAEKDMRRYLSKLEDAHWATLKATVSHGGAFIGRRHIDLPRDFSLLYDGQIAPIWGEQVIKTVRQRTSQLAADYVELVEQVVQWADVRGARNHVKGIAALRDQIRTDAKTLAAVGKEGGEELRQQVKEKLLRAIAQPIRRRCIKFVENGKHSGRGVKRRILEFFDDLVPMVIDAVRNPTLGVLKGNFSTVELEIREHFDKYPDPLQTVEHVIVKTHSESEQRGVTQRRGRIMQQLAKALMAQDQERESGRENHGISGT